jgi:hypothetical protein
MVAMQTSTTGGSVWRFNSRGERTLQCLDMATSTGAAMMLNYVIENNDDAFDAFLFSSHSLTLGSSRVFQRVYPEWLQTIY